MNIALVIFGALDDRSGGFRYDRELVEALRRRGHEVSIVSQRRPSRYGEQLTQARESDWIDGVLAIDPGLVLIDELNHASTASGLPVLRNGLGGSVPIVAVVHHLRSDEGRGRLWSRRVERRFLRGCDGWLCNGTTTLGRVIRISGCMRHSAVVMPGRDEAPSSRVPSDVLKGSSQDLRSGNIRILTVGSIEPRKNIATLIRAVGSIPAARLTVVGSREVDPVYARRLDRIVTRLDVGDRVRFTGRVSPSELEQYYLESDLFALPSWYEGFGIVYLEAMNHGLPVIATRCGGARDLVRHGMEGYLVDPRSPGSIAAAILQFAGAEASRRGLTDAAVRRAQSFPIWERSMIGAVHFLEQVAMRPLVREQER